jgi:hypothetical protein
MVDVERLKVLVLCCDIIQSRLKAGLKSEFVDAAFYTNCGDVLAHFERECCDIVLVDSLHEGASRICRFVYSSVPIPVALLVKSNALNWKNWGSWQVDGFIPEEAGNLELIARVRAIAKRPIKSNCLSRVSSST